jgi:hypothetical protein
MDKAFESGSENSGTFSVVVEVGEEMYLWVPYAFVGCLSVSPRVYI